MTAVNEGDLVLDALGQLGSALDCAGFNRLDLEGPQVLWLAGASSHVPSGGFHRPQPGGLHDRSGHPHAH
ncbi:hypothetical protein ACWDRX_36730, partial [Streptomyces nigra]